MNKLAVVAGGVNVDISGRAFRTLREKDSNPGQVRVTPGGVGRNIAQGLSQLGVPVELLTALGEDAFADRIRESCRKLDIGLDHARTVPGGVTSSYLCLCGADGDMALAVSDMELCESITPDYLEGALPLIEKADVLIMDANLPGESLCFLAERAEVPLFADPVSTTKAEKLRPILGKLHTLKPNRLEAELLSGVSIHDEESLLRAADALLKTGLKRLFLSLGADGVLAAEGDVRLRLPAKPTHIVNATGAGDSFLAALGWAWLEGKNLRDSAEAGLTAAALTLNSENTVSPALCQAALDNRR